MAQTPQSLRNGLISIDQATHITGRDLKKELLKKSDGVVRKHSIHDG